MLNPPANDLQRTAQERRNWDTNWDPRSVWLTEFTESGGLVSISGRAMSNDDIAEFNTRLANSVYFSGVRLNNTRALQDTALGRIFQFQLTATVNYGIVDDQG
jgi:Tfp pilus assembly protein PilN